jgi:predicted DCC family thiol-disulfide oxidoreductase YuxK
MFDKPIIFYDGDCGLCDHFVRQVLKFDSATRFSFSPLQGQTAQKVLPTINLNSMRVRTPDGAILREFPAVLFVLSFLQVAPILVLFLNLIPTPIGNFGYRLVARLRRRLFPAPACPISRNISEQAKNRFLP